jgi:hypothetical protein
MYLYSSLPDHPWKGYQYIRGEIDMFISSSFNKEEIVKVSFKEEFEKHIAKYSPKFMTLVALVIACHWDIGVLLYKNMKVNQNGEIELSPNFAKKEAEFIKNALFFYNSHVDWSPVSLSFFLKILILISTADVLGQRPFLLTEWPYHQSNIEELQGLIFPEFPNTENYSSPRVNNSSLDDYIFKAKFLIERYVPSNLEKINNCLYNSYDVLENLMMLSMNPYTIQSMFDEFPQIIAFDWDQTLSEYSSIYENCQDSFYKLFPQSLDIILSLQKCRPDCKIGIVSRHYFPNNLQKEFSTEINGKPFYDYFDFICSIYTGNENDQSYANFKHYCSRIEKERDFLWYKEGGEIFTRTRDNQEFYVNEIFNDIDFNNLLTYRNKKLHFNMIQKIYPYVNFTNIILLDDDDLYVLNNNNIRIQNEITVIKAIPSRGVVDFNRVLAMYCYEKVRNKKMKHFNDSFPL